MQKQNNYAFIDSQNVNLSILDIGWKLNFFRFRKYLFDKYHVQKAYLFIGFVDGNNDLYAHLQEAGFICIFKPTLKYKNGKTKGNVDAELVLHTMLELENLEKAVIVTGDGDFHCLLKHLVQRDKLKVLMVPNDQKYSALLKMKIFKPYLRFMNGLKAKLEDKKEKPQ